MLKFVQSSLRFYWRSHIGILLGTMLATAVLTGSLLVGDSVDGSLRKAALQRLGGIQHAMVLKNRYVSKELAGRISADSSPLLRLRGMALADEQQVNQVQVHGCEASFWLFAELQFDLKEDEVALNSKLAEALKVQLGDEVSLRIEKPGILPREAPLSEQKSGRSVRGRFRVARILSNDELGRFSLSAEQVVPYNAFVRYTWLSERTELQGKSNLLLTRHDQPDEPLAGVWRPEDFGLRFREVNDVLQLESESIYLEPEVVRAAQAVGGSSGTLTYLVNSLRFADKSTPYSFVLADESRGLAEGEIIINRWLADSLGCSVGDALEMNYYELLPRGEFAERTSGFKVHSIAEMNSLEAERQRAPAFPGLTDVDRCSDWDVGIPMDEDELADEANEVYWNQYKQTPKAVISLKAGQSMWSNRFGSLTSVRWGNGSVAAATFKEEFNPLAAGYTFLPVRAQALASVDQAMDFGQLFAGMSFFLIIASLMLTGLLFVFSVQKRSEEMGILLATGWRPANVRNALLLEGAVPGGIGSLIGALIGVGYTKLLLIGLSGGWGGAIAGASVDLFVTSSTVITGAVSGFICAMLSMGIAIWKQVKHPARELLMMDFSQPDSSKLRTGTPALVAGAITLLSAAGIGIYSMTSGQQSITLPFFGAGALCLMAGILFFSAWLKQAGTYRGTFDFKKLAVCNLTRRPGRSLAVTGLLAVGCFLVFSVASMKEDMVSHADQSWSGTGGFAWIGESTLPIPETLGGIGIRVRDGDDAGCLNLNRAREPELLGIAPDVLSERSAFFDDHDIWPLLNLDLPDGMIPALVGDADTALWGLEAAVGPEKGDVLLYTDDSGAVFKVKLVGHLPMRLSVFQGSVLIAEKNFVNRFPSEEGYRMFLWDANTADGGAGRMPAVRSGGEAGRMPAVQKYERSGLDIVRSVDRLIEFYTVESTYLSMFLVLGILGLMVGSLGMGIVVMRNIQDRRAELALMRAVGYRTRAFRKLLGLEHALLAAIGLGIGMLSAAVAMVPAVFVSATKVSVGFQVLLFMMVPICCLGCMALAVVFGAKDESLRGLRNE